MYTWFIDYFYIGSVAVITAFSLIPVWLVDKKVFKNESKLRVVVLTFIFTCLMIIGLLWLKYFHIDVIRSICFDWPLYVYKEDPIPKGCFIFDNSKYMGVGWPLTAMFWIAFDFVYLIVIYALWVSYGYFKNGSLKS